MIKCKNANCPSEKDICCNCCDMTETCAGGCKDSPHECEESIFEGETEVQVFENKAAIVIKKISDIVLKKKELEAEEKTMREQLQKAMEEHEIIKFDNDVISVAYTKPTTRKSVDSTKLKKELPDIYEKYSKTSDVKASVKITVK